MFPRRKLDQARKHWRLLYEQFDSRFLFEDEDEDEEEVEDEEGEEVEDEEGEGEEGEADGEESGIGDEYEQDTDALYRRIQGLLNNDIFNHAAIVERLWGERGASNRSRFRKKLYRETTDDGYQYSFERQELSDILAILGRAGSEAVSAYQKGRMKKRTPVSEK